MMIFWPRSCAARGRGTALVPAPSFVSDATEPRAAVTWEGAGKPIVLTLYGPEGELAAMELLPKRCLTLSKEILDIAVRAIKVDWPG